MGVFDFLKKDVRGVSANQSSGGNLPLEMLFQFNASLGKVVWYSSDSTELLEKGYLSNHIIFSIMDWIGNKVASAPLNLYKIKNDKSYTQYKSFLSDPTKESVKRALDIRHKALEEVFDNPLLTMLNKPNDLMSRYEFYYGTYIYKECVGSSYWFDVRNGINDPTTGEITKMYLPPAHKVKIVGGGYNKPIEGYVLNSNVTKMIDAKNVCQIRNFSPIYNTEYQFLYGLSKLYAAKDILLKYNEGNAVEAGLYQKKGVRDFIFPKGQFDINDQSIEQISAMTDTLNRKLMTNESGIVANTVELGSIRVGFSPVEMGILESQKVTKEDFLALFHVDGSIFPWSNTSTYNNKVEGRKLSLIDAVIPNLNAIKDGINHHVVPSYTKNRDYVVEFDLGVFPELQDDMKDTVAWMNTAGCFTPNEKRTALGYDASDEENANNILVPSNVTILEDLGLGSMPSDNNLFQDEVVKE